MEKHPIKTVVATSLLIVNVDININDSSVIIGSNECYSTPVIICVGAN